MLSIETIATLLLRERRFPVLVSETKAKKSQVASISKLIDEVTDHNYVAGKELIEAMSNMSASDLKEAFDAFLTAYKLATGDYVNMNKFTIYQNYPHSILNDDMVDVLIEQYVSYVAQYCDRVFGTNMHHEIFDKEIIERGEDDEYEYETIKSVVLRPGTEKDALSILTAMMAGKLNLSFDDTHLLKESLMALDNETLISILPTKIYQKTTLKVVASVLLSKEIELDILGIKNAVDAIRLAHELSGTIKGFSLKNNERMAILSLINKDKHANANMFPHREDFLRLGEHIHPAKYSKRFPNAAQAFSELRNKVRTERNFMSQYNTAILNGDVIAAATALSYAAGKFTQELDALLSLAVTEERQNAILDIYEAVAKNAPAKRLYQTYVHFMNRIDGSSVVKDTFDRYSRPMEYAKEVIALPEAIIERAANIAFNAFAENKQELEAVKYYINEERFSKTIIDKVGSRIAIRDTAWLRLFCYWVGQDVDLSAVFLDEKFNYKAQVSWQSLREGEPGDVLAVHSRDITCAFNGGTEYIDVNRNKAKELAETSGYRYIAIINVVFSGPAFHNMDDAFVGVTAINESEMGSVFKPNAVVIKSKIKSGRANLAFLYDIVEDEVILVNSDITPENARCCTVSSCIFEIVKACNAVTTSEKYNLYQYLSDAITAAGGELVSEKQDADVIFDVDGIDIFDDVLYSKYI